MWIRQNCWEFKGCGRESHTVKDAGLDICPATIDTSCDGINRGKNAGRICWVIAGTFCENKVQGTFAQKRRSCITCDFFKLVEAEQGVENFRILKPGQNYHPDE